MKVFIFEWTNRDGSATGKRECLAEDETNANKLNAFYELRGEYTFTLIGTREATEQELKDSKERALQGYN
jgi:hypothetical protein